MGTDVMEVKETEIVVPEYPKLPTQPKRAKSWTKSAWVEVRKRDNVFYGFAETPDGGRYGCGYYRSIELPLQPTRSAALKDVVEWANKYKFRITKLTLA